MAHYEWQAQLVGHTNGDRFRLAAIHDNHAIINTK